MDIIANHTADVIHTEECAGQATASIAASPTIRISAAAALAGAAINPGFDGDSASGELRQADRPQLRLYA